MKRVYAKPVMNVERFLANVAIASCTREETDQVIQNLNPQTIYCYRSSDSEVIFSNGTSGCHNYPTGMVYIATPGTYTQSDLVRAGLISLRVDNAHGGSVTIPQGGGWVLTWTSGYTNCYGLATGELTKVFTSSY